MARKPTLSPSRISVYLACPVKYRWSYVDPRGRWFMKSKSYYSFGTTLHNALQKFHQSGGVGVNTLDEVLENYETSFIDAGYQTPEHAQEHRTLGRQLIESYYANQEEAPPESTTLFIEKQFRKDLGEFVLIGRVDRVEQHPDGSLEIIDYKSGRTEVTEDEVKDDLAMGIYQLLLKHHYPNQKVTATIIALRTGVSASASMTKAGMIEFENDLIILGKEILEADYELFNPTYKEICHECDFLSLCRKDNEFKAIFDAAEAVRDLTGDF